jgi:hypothetical protein
MWHCLLCDLERIFADPLRGFLEWITHMRSHREGT